jgi:hypothetical protein
VGCSLPCCCSLGSDHTRCQATHQQLLPACVYPSLSACHRPNAAQVTPAPTELSCSSCSRCYTSQHGQFIDLVLPHGDNAEVKSASVKQQQQQVQQQPAGKQRLWMGTELFRWAALSSRCVPASCLGPEAQSCKLPAASSQSKLRVVSPSASCLLMLGSYDGCN